MRKVFISHSTDDKPFINQELIPAFTKRGIEFWYDESDMMASLPLIDQIEVGIDESDFVLVIMSQASQASTWVLDEIRTAVDKLSPTQLIAARVDEVDPRNFPANLIYYKNKERLWVDFSKDDSAIDKLIEAICEVQSPYERAMDDARVLRKNDHSFSDAIQKYSEALEFSKKNSHRWEALIERGRCRLDVVKKLRDSDQTKTLETARDDFCSAAQLDSSKPEAFRYAGEVSFELGDFQLARKYYKQALNSDPESYVVLNDLACVEFVIAQRESDGARRKDKLEKASEYARDCVNLRPGNSVYQKNFGLILEKQGELQRAESAFSEAVMLSPNESELRFCRAYVLHQMGDLKQCIPEYSRALSLDEKMRYAYGLGYAYLHDALEEDQKLRRDRKLKQAEEAFTHAINAEQEDKVQSALVGRARIRFLLDDLSGCIDDATTAFNANKRDKRAALILGRALFRCGEEEKAEKILTATHKYGGCVEACYSLEQIYKAKKEKLKRDAIMVEAKSLGWSKKKQPFLSWRGISCNLQGEAINARELSPSDYIRFSESTNGLSLCHRSGYTCCDSGCM